MKTVSVQKKKLVKALRKVQRNAKLVSKNLNRFTKSNLYFIFSTDGLYIREVYNSDQSLCEVEEYILYSINITYDKKYNIHQIDNKMLDFIKKSDSETLQFTVNDGSLVLIDDETSYSFHGTIEHMPLLENNYNSYKEYMSISSDDVKQKFDILDDLIKTNASALGRNMMYRNYIITNFNNNIYSGVIANGGKYIELYKSNSKLMKDPYRSYIPAGLMDIINKTYHVERRLTDEPNIEIRKKYDNFIVKIDGSYIMYKFPNSSIPPNIELLFSNIKTVVEEIDLSKIKVDKNVSIKCENDLVINGVKVPGKIIKKEEDINLVIKQDDFERLISNTSSVKIEFSNNRSPFILSDDTCIKATMPIISDI